MSLSIKKNPYISEFLNKNYPLKSANGQSRLEFKNEGSITYLKEKKDKVLTLMNNVNPTFEPHHAPTYYN